MTINRKAMKFGILAAAHWHSVRQLEKCLADPNSLRHLPAYPNRTVSNDPSGELHVALVVYRAFCVELYLKAIYVAEGHDNKNCHELKILFNQLEDKNKEKIIDQVNDPDFYQKLEEASGEFVEWRYMDSGHVKSDTGFMSKFMDAASDQWTRVSTEQQVQC